MKPKERFLNACFQRPVDRPPVWMMRQAGRYLAPYRELRARHTTLKMMQTPELATEITMQPTRLVGVDAAILYSDILMVPDAMGLKLEFVEGKGPLFVKKIQTIHDVDALDIQNSVGRLNFVFETVERVQQLLKKEAGPEGPLPLLGFAGAPFTVATYMVEGQGSENFATLHQLLKESPATLKALLEKITQATIDYLGGQIQAGIDALQLFDTWGGILTPQEFSQWSLPYTRRVFEALKPSNVPTILFVKSGGPLLDEVVVAGANVIGIDWQTKLSEAKFRTQSKVALQGNLNPSVLLRSIPEIETAVDAMVSDWGGGPGYIMNLGHGILPETPVSHAKAFIEACQKYGGKYASK